MSAAKGRGAIVSYATGESVVICAKVKSGRAGEQKSGRVSVYVCVCVSNCVID